MKEFWQSGIAKVAHTNAELAFKRRSLPAFRVGNSKFSNTLPLRIKFTRADRKKNTIHTMPYKRWDKISWDKKHGVILTIGSPRSKEGYGRYIAYGHKMDIVRG